jgi:hypothetical protein
MLFDLTQLFFTLRCFVVILVLLSMAWIPIINSFSNSQLFVYIQSISSFLTPPVAATFLMAIFWHRTTEPVRLRDFLFLCLSVSLYLCLSVSLYIQSISSFVTPPVAATFLMAIFWHRTTEPVRFRFSYFSVSLCLSVYLSL